MKIEKINFDGKKDTIEVLDKIFSAKINSKLVSSVLYKTNANYKGRHAKTKQQNEVSGPTSKIYAQKGTGGARHASRKAPIFVGGGRAHGPTGLENWTLKLSRTMKKKALIIALSAQIDNVFVTDNLLTLDGKTKSAAKLLKNLKITGQKILIATEGDNELIRRSFNNIQRVNVMKSSLANALDIVSADAIIFSKEAVRSLEKRLVKKV